MSISQTTQDAWQANTRSNLVLLQHLTPEMLEATTPGGGFSVAEQLAHITGTTTFWGLQLDEAFGILTEFFDPNTKSFTAGIELADIGDVMRRTAETARQAAQTAEDKGSLPHPSAAAYLIRMMVHDAHHRG